MRRGLVITLVLVAVGATVIAGVGAAAVWTWHRAALDTTDRIEFTRPLAVPPLAESELDDQGRRVFQLTARAGTHDFGPHTSPTWGFNGDYLGPTLRARRGEQVLVRVTNQLPETTTVHWHGMHLPATMDGGPHQPVPPGDSWSPTWRIDQPAATLWYHPHPHGATEKHVLRGLAGMFILDDDASSQLPLPRRYGVDDIPVIVQDLHFDRGGRLSPRKLWSSPVGHLGDTIAVNGVVAPYLDVTTERVRLRLLNASSARIYQFGFADGREFALVGTDGGLLPAPVSTTQIRLSPGERAEIVVTMRPGERVVLRSSPPDLGVSAPIRRFVGGDDRLDVLELRAAPTLAPSPELPAQLAEVPLVPVADAVATRDFRLADLKINGQPMDMTRIDLTATAGTVERWRVRAVDGLPHNFHAHGVSFQVLSVNGHPPGPELGGWQDTVYLPPEQLVELAVQFGHHTDPAAPYMYHCHLLSHEDSGMMGQFVVVAPGEVAQPPAAPGHR